MRHSLLLAAVCAALGAFGCQGHPKEYVIGAAGPQQLPYGILNQRGIDLAVEEINHAGGIHGVPLRVEVRDDQATGVEATRIAANFADDSRILGVIGHVNSAAMVSAAHVYDTEHLVAITTSASSPDLTGISSWVFRMITSDSTNGMIIAQFANALGHALGRRPRAAVLYQNDAYGRGLADAFTHSFAGDVISSDPISSTTDMEPYVTYFKQHKPDIVFSAGDESSGLPLLQEARRQHLDATLIGGDGWQSVAEDPAADGVYIGVPFTTHSGDSAAQRFVTAYRAKYKHNPNGMVALAYDATKLLAQAIEQSHGTRDAVRDALKGLRASNAYRGVSGTLWFTPQNDPGGDHFRMTRVSHGTMIPVVADTTTHTVVSITR